MCVYIYIYTRSIDGVTMFRAIKTVARVDDGGASVSIRRQLTSPPGIPIRRMERWSHVGRNIAHAATLFSHQFKDYSDLWLGLHLIVEIVGSRRGERSLLAKDHAWRKKRSARLLGIRAHIDRRSLREREEIKTPIRNPSDSHVRIEGIERRGMERDRCGRYFFRALWFNCGRQQGWHRRITFYQLQ